MVSTAESRHHIELTPPKPYFQNKMRILIINFTRMGDLLQSTPLMRGLKRKYPDSESTLLVLDDFRGICGGFPGIDRLLTMDVNRFVPRLADQGLSIENHFTYMNKFIERVGTGYDLVINLSHTTLSAVLAFLTDSKDVRGMVLTKDGAPIVKHPWMNYFFNVARNRLQNGINLVDMYNLTGEIEMLERKEYYEVPYDAQSFPDEFLKDYSGEFAGFQLGASSADRCWEPQYFAKLAELLYEKMNYRVIVFGTGSEGEKLKEMKSQCRVEVIDALGETTMPQLAAMLKRCKFLVTNDTGTMHLAAAVGTPAVALFLGEARPADTGPYTEKAVVLEANISCAPCGYDVKCLDHTCHKYITPEDVLWVMRNFDEIISNEIDYLTDEPKWSKVKISKPVFDEDGFWNLVPLIKRSLTFNDYIKELYRRMWKNFLSGGRYAGEPDFMRYFTPPESGEFEREVERFEADLMQMRELAEKGVNLIDEFCQVIDPPNVEALKRLTKEMIILDNAIYHMELTRSAMGHIATTFRIKKKNTESGDLHYIADMAGRIYQDALKMTEMMLDDLEYYTARLNMEAEAV